MILEEKNFPLKELWVIFHNIESTEHKMLEAATDLDKEYANLRRIRKDACFVS